MWKDLRHCYEKLNFARVFCLHKEIGDFTHQGTLFVTDYYNKLRTLWDKYSAVFSLSSPQQGSCDGAKIYNAQLETQQ